MRMLSIVGRSSFISWRLAPSIVRPRGEEAKAIKREAGFKARRWMVERSHSWTLRFRRLLVRWDKKPENYLALLHFACGLIAFRAAGLFGYALSAGRHLLCRNGSH